MKREKLILVVFMLCSFAVGTVFAQYELQKPNWCVVDCGFNVTMTTGTCRLDSSIGPPGEDDWMIYETASGYRVESGFYQINYSSWVANPTFVFSDTEISSTTIRFKLDTGSNPDWTQYAIAYSTAVNPSGLFTGTTYYIKKDGSINWNPASFYEGVELTSLKPNTIYGFKIRSRIPPPELVSTDWSGNTDNYTWTHIETPGISVQVYITSATVTAVGPFSNLGAGSSGINFGRNGSYAGWTTATSSHTFTGLASNTLYTFQVKARNGQSYETNVNSTSKYTLCGPPRNPNITNVTSSSLTLSWSAPLGTVEYYWIKENEVPIQDNYTQLSLDRADLEYVNFRYVYKIYAVNQADETDPISSVSVSAYTLCSIPPAPEILNVSADTVEIVINEGDNYISDSTEYSIRVSGGGTESYVQDDYTVGGSEWFDTKDIWGDPLITTLLSNVEYDISVRAKNMSGAVTGYGTSVSSCTYAAVPGLSVEQTGPSLVTITILEGNNSPPTEYAIQGYKFDVVWSYLGWLDTDKAFYPSERWHTKDEWGGGSGFTLSLNLSYGYKFNVKARRTIPGYSKEETGLSANAYVGNVVVTPTANIGIVELSAGTAYYYNTNQTVTFTAIGVDKIHYTYTTDGTTDPEDPNKETSPGGSPPVAFLLTASAKESETYRIKAKAWQGEVESDWAGVWIVVIDKDAPTINSFSIEEGEQTTSQKINLSIYATGADYMKIEGDVTISADWIDYSNSKIVWLEGDAGDKEVSVTVKDKAGNESSSAIDTILYDPHPPSITGFRIEEGDYTDARENIHLIEINATAAKEMFIDGDVEDDNVTKEWIVYDEYNPSAQVTLTSGDGEKTVKIKVRNAVYTESEFITCKITLDTTLPPDPELVLSDPDSPNPEYTNDRLVRVSITNSTELDEDTECYEYILSETQATQPSATAAWWPKPIPDTYQLSPDYGEKKVYIWVKDVVGHINAGPAFDTITLDMTPPQNPSLSIDGGPYANSPDVTLQISATDANLRDMRIKGDVTGSNTGNWIKYASTETVTLTAGDVPKTITIKFRDEAGNEISAEPCIITLETTPPVIEGDIEASFVQHDNTPLQEATETGCQSPTFIWKATDTLSGIGGYSYSFSPVATVQPTIDITTDSILLQLTTSYADGTYYFKVKAMDNASNFSSVETFVYEYKADSVSPEATIQVESKERVGDEVKGVKANAIPEIDFTEEVWGAKQYVQVELIRDNEGKEYKDIIVSCEINSITALLWKIDPGKDWQGNYTYRITAKDGVEDNAGNSLKEEKKLTFTTMLDRTKRNVVMWESEGNPEDPNAPKTKMTLEANALKENGYVSINLEPLPLKGTGVREAKEVNKEAIIEADEKIKRSGDRYCYNLRECMREISGYNTEDGKMVLDKFLNTVYLELPYGDSKPDGIDGIVDSTEGTSAPVREQTLSIYWLDEEHKLWVKVSGTKVDKDKNIASARVMGFGTYTLMGGGFYDLADAYAYPVPYKPNDGLSTTGDETSGITFINLSTEAEIKIYTITGELVKKLIHRNGWDEEWYPVENEKGEKVVSGVYIYYITNNKQHKSGKLVIIR